MTHAGSSAPLSELEDAASEALQAGNYEAARRLLEPLAERDSHFALLSLGWLYETGALAAPDADTARLYYEGAAWAGSPEGYYRLGALLLDQGDEDGAKAAFVRGAALGDEDARVMVEKFADQADEQLAFEAIEAER